jgi:hypothetical protein
LSCYTRFLYLVEDEVLVPELGACRHTHLRIDSGYLEALL